QRRQLEAALVGEVEGLLVRVAADGLGRLDRRHLGLGWAAGAGRGRGDGGGRRVLPRRSIGVGFVGLIIGGCNRSRSSRGGCRQRTVGFHLVGVRQAMARLAGRGGGLGGSARGLARFGGLGRTGGAGLGALLGGPACGVGEVAQAQAHGIGQAPQRQRQEQQAQDDARAGDLQRAQTVGGQAGDGVAPQSAHARRQRPFRGRRRGRKGGRQQQY